MVFHWSLSDSKSPQVSWSLLSILAVLNNVVVWMVSTRPPTSKSSSLFNSPLFTVPKVPILHLWEFFTSVLADNAFLLKFLRRQVLKGVQDSSQNSCRYFETLFWMVYPSALVSKLSSLFINPSGIIPKASITIGITITLMHHSFFALYQGLHIYLSIRNF